MMNSPLRILTVADTPCDPNSGAAGTVYYTNQALREIGHEVDEIWADDLGPRRIAHGNLHSLLEQPRAYRRAVMKATRAKQYDLIILDQPQAYLACKALKQSNFPGVILNRSHGVELRVNQVLPKWHQKYHIPESRYPPLITYTLRSLLDRQWQEVIKYCDGIIVSSSLDEKFLTDFLKVDQGKVCLAPQGLSDELLNQPELIDTDTSPVKWWNLLYVGQFAFIKGYFVLAEIINRVLIKNPNIRFTWVASAKDHGRIKTLILPDILERVQLLDWMSQSQLKETYSQHGIFIFPSFYEGFGKTPLEAMACGLCVVASDEGGMHDYIDSGNNGYLCPVGDVDEFVEVINNLILDLEKTKNIARAAKRFSTSYTWKSHAFQILEYLKSFKQK
ncbi:glycosyltransferase family 4 protein [Sphaerospermopsis sp. FACHB-1194]|uniref:glycosyltransferase family 4 protein n=1 Tax=Sphaerospermopsis sp. FACHB-1194 TaxID=2692862 RepID=UPI0016809B95|nr:glycosyltransferase family 4 protein [Sphaerospermopsis sp. FACHB-1194]MBD2143834.1 glycosyltransferase family 4 protein [Sphaerospermopsis sp. FACHB-1194]